MAKETLAAIAVTGRGAMMDDPMKQEISEIIARLPEWVRRDLNAKDSTIRERAEDALTAMMLNAMHVAKPD